MAKKGFFLIDYAMAGFLLLGLLGVKAEAQPQDPLGASKKVRPSEVQDVTLRLSGQSCDKHIVDVESALLHLRTGVTMVDIEKKKRPLVCGLRPCECVHRSDAEYRGKPEGRRLVLSG